VKNLLKNHRGDTIVEVLIAITVLSFIMGASYTLANKSSLAVRQSQERGESFKLTETQIEKLKQYASVASVSNAIPGSGSVFCMKTDGTIQAFDAGKSPPADAQQENFISYPAECKNGEFYYTFVSRTGNTFTAHTRWEKVNGDGIDEATMVYRIYPDTIAALGDSPLSVGGCNQNKEFNSVGNCVPCGPGQGSPGGGAKCEDIPPKITVSVQQLRAGPNDTVPPPCNPPGTPSINLPVSITDPGGITTSSNAPATFDGLIPNRNYSLNLQEASLPAHYRVCSQNPVTKSTGGLDTTTNHTFIIQPICDVRKTRTVTETRTRLVPQYGPPIYWWQHTGPGWGPYGPYTPWQGPPNPRYAIGNNKSGFPAEYYATEQSVAGRGTVSVRYALLNTSNPNESNAWYNRFEWWSGQPFLGFIPEPYNVNIEVPYDGCPYP
jgi:hypothetical protein